jgi:hypothetical protein
MLQRKQRAVIIILIGLGLIIVGFFGLRTARAFREFHGHRPPPVFSEDSTPETDVEFIRHWMTIPFISKTYRVPERILFEALGIPERGNRDKSLRQLNEEYFRHTPGFVETAIKAALLENTHPPMHPTIPVP